MISFLICLLGNLDFLLFQLSSKVPTPSHPFCRVSIFWWTFWSITPCALNPIQLSWVKLLLVPLWLLVMRILCLGTHRKRGWILSVAQVRVKIWLHIFASSALTWQDRITTGPCLAIGCKVKDPRSCLSVPKLSSCPKAGSRLNLTGSRSECFGRKLRLCRTHHAASTV